MGFWQKLFGGASTSKQGGSLPPEPSAQPRAKVDVAASSREDSTPPEPSTQPRGKVNAASFLQSVEDGNLDEVKALLKAVPGLISIKESGGWGETALHKAVGKGNVEMVKLLLASGADVNANDANDQFPLFDAVNRDREEIVGILLSNKAAINATNTPGKSTALHVAQSKNVAELLLRNGANINAKTPIGVTPLHNAASKGRLAVAETLLAHGADVHAKTENGHTPLAYAEREKKSDVAELLRGHSNVARKPSTPPRRESITPPTPPKSGNAAAATVSFLREEKRPPVAGVSALATYRYYKAPSAAAALDFLNGQQVSQQLFYLCVESPDGRWVKDCTGLFDA